MTKTTKNVSGIWNKQEVMAHYKQEESNSNDRKVVCLFVFKTFLFLRLSNMYTMLLWSSYTILIFFLHLLPYPFQPASSHLLVFFVYLFWLLIIQQSSCYCSYIHRCRAFIGTQEIRQWPHPQNNDSLFSSTYPLLTAPQ